MENCTEVIERAKQAVAQAIANHTHKDKDLGRPVAPSQSQAVTEPSPAVTGVTEK